MVHYCCALHKIDQLRFFFQEKKTRILIEQSIENTKTLVEERVYILYEKE
jgi:hypothetical protein